MFDAATISFFVLTILGGQVCVPLLLATCLLSKRVHRHPLLLGFMTCWVAYSLSTCILLYSGHQDDKEVDHSLCLAQAASVNGSLIAAAIAAFLLVLHLRLTMPRHDKPFAKLGFGPKATFGFAIIPPISLIVYLSAMLAVERNHPGLLQTERRDLICGFRSTGAAWYADRITPIIIGVFLVVSLCLSSFLFTITYSRRATLHSGSSSAPWMRVLLRFTIFAVYAFLTALACLFRIVLKDTMTLHTVVALYVATLPLAAFVVFGSLPDVLAVWFRRPSHATATAATPATRSATVPWDLHDPDEMVSHFSHSGEALTREGAMSERWEPDVPIATAAQQVSATGSGEKLLSSPVANRTGAKRGNVLRKTSGLMRSASSSKQTQPNFTGTSDMNDGSQRPHLAETYYVNRIAREYYANRQLEERAKAAAYDQDDVTSPLRYTPSDSLLRSTPSRSTPNRSTPESDYFTQPPARRTSPHRRASARSPVVPSRSSDEVSPSSRYAPPRRPLSRPSSLYDADADADADLFYSAPSDPESPTLLGSPVPLMPSPVRQVQVEYTMPVMAPRAAYATHHYMAMAPVRQASGPSGL